MRRMRVRSRHFEYDVLVGQGAWRALREWETSQYTSIFIVTERALWRRWEQTFLRSTGLKKSRAVFVPSGESSKSLRRVELVTRNLLAQGADRRSLLVAFGGGVVGDLAGFVASTYMRGIDCIQVPTTVVAQVDSSIGGKTAVDVGGIKNLIGTFYPPRLVLAEPQVLSSLDDRTFRSGFYEVVKHAILAGEPLFGNLEKHFRTLRRRSNKLETVLAPAAEVKVDIVTRDEREAGLRRVLNLGHTFGHALEEATQYQRLLHGEAVGWGLHCATRLGELLGLLPAREAARITSLVREVGPLPPINDLRPARILSLLSRDKKTVGGRIHWVVPEKIGKVQIISDVPVRITAQALRDVQQAGFHG